MKTNAELKQHVEQELEWGPSIDAAWPAPGVREVIGPFTLA